MHRPYVVARIPKGALMQTAFACVTVSPVNDDEGARPRSLRPIPTVRRLESASVSPLHHDTGLACPVTHAQKRSASGHLTRALPRGTGSHGALPPNTPAPRFAVASRPGRDALDPVCLVRS